jgi:hypothetical protein
VWGTGDGGGVVSGGIPSYNSGVMTETILHHTSSLDGLLERLSPEPDVRGEEFERGAKWFLETDPAYATELRGVWLWDDWPGYWGPDNGIDLVAETHTPSLSISSMEATREEGRLSGHSDARCQAYTRFLDAGTRSQLENYQ